MKQFKTILSVFLVGLLVLTALPTTSHAIDNVIVVDSIQLYQDGKTVTDIKGGGLEVKAEVSNLGVADLNTYVCTLLCEGEEELYVVRDAAAQLTEIKGKSFETVTTNFNVPLSGDFFVKVFAVDTLDEFRLMGAPALNTDFELNMLKSLSINDNPIPGFKSTKTEYKMDINEGTPLPLKVSAVPLSGIQEAVTITQPQTLPGEIKIKVSYPGLPDMEYTVVLTEKQSDLTVDYYGGANGVNDLKLVYNMSSDTKRFWDTNVTFDYGLPRTVAQKESGLPSPLEGALYLQPKFESTPVYTRINEDWIRLTLRRSATIYCLSIGPSTSPTGNMAFLSTDDWTRIENFGSTNTSVKDGTWLYTQNDATGVTRYGWRVNGDSISTNFRVFLYEKHVEVPPGESVTISTRGYGSGPSSSNPIMYSLAIQFEPNENESDDEDNYGSGGNPRWEPPTEDGTGLFTGSHSTQGEKTVISGNVSSDKQPYVLLRVAKAGISLATAKPEDYIWIGATQADETGDFSFAIPTDKWKGTFEYSITCSLYTTAVTDSLTVNSQVARGLLNYSIDGVTDTIRDGVITLTFPYGTNVTGLISEFELLGDSRLKIDKVYQESGVSRNNFKSDIVYTIEHFDGSTESVIVKVIVSAPVPPAKNSAGGGLGGGGNIHGGTKIVTDYTSPPIQPLVKTKIPFKDVGDSHWAYDAIEDMYAQNVITGDDNEDFRPDAPIVREEFIKMIVSFFDIPEGVSDTTFVDVEQTSWYEKYVNSVVAYGVVNGIGDNLFGVGQYVTRQDLAVIIYRTLIKKGIMLENSRSMTQFTDSDDISEYAGEAVAAFCNAEIIRGYEDLSFRPLNNISRAEVCAVLSRIKQLTTESALTQ